MKYCGRAALLMVAWYLMIPPIDATNKVDVKAPILQWRRGVKFDTQQKCIDSLQDAIKNPITPQEYEEARRATQKAGMQPLSREEMTRRTASSQCVAEDDPRLKRK